MPVTYDPRTIRTGWWWYNCETLSGIHLVPVYLRQDGGGNWFACESPEDQEEPIGFLSDLEGSIIQWIGEGTTDVSTN